MHSIGCGVCQCWGTQTSTLYFLTEEDLDSDLGFAVLPFGARLSVSTYDFEQPCLWRATQGILQTR